MIDDPESNPSPNPNPNPESRPDFTPAVNWMNSRPEEDSYVNIRDILGHYIGCQLVDISQHDREDWDQGMDSYVLLLFSNGGRVKFIIQDQGFQFDTKEQLAG